MSDEDAPLHSPPSPRLVCNRTLLSVVIGGQLLALLVTGTGVFSQLLADRGVNIPTSQSFANYVVLSFFLVPRYFRWRRRRRSISSRTQQGVGGEWKEADSEDAHTVVITHDNVETVSDSINPDVTRVPSPASSSFLLVPSWKYLFLAACDVEGNFLLVKAYQYTTITSVQLLDCFTIPVVMVLGYFFMRVVYNRKHLFGAFICLVGLVLLVCSDLLTKRNDAADAAANNKVLGDMLVLIGCVCYAISNLGQEYLVKSFNRFEFLGMLGMWGSVVSAIQMALLERDALRQVEFSNPIVLLYLLGFNLCLFLLYYFTPLLLAHSSALFLNLSFLTADFWSILFAVALFHASLNALYFGAFAIIIVGLLVYNLAGVEASIGDILKALCRAPIDAEDAEEALSDDADADESRARTKRVGSTDGLNALGDASAPPHSDAAHHTYVSYQRPENDRQLYCDARK